MWYDRQTGLPWVLVGIGCLARMALSLLALLYKQKATFGMGFWMWFPGKPSFPPLAWSGGAQVACRVMPSHAWLSGWEVLGRDQQGHVLEDEQLEVVHQLSHLRCQQWAVHWVHLGSLEELAKVQCHPEDAGGSAVWDGHNEVGQFHLSPNPFVKQGVHVGGEQVLCPQHHC